MIVYVRDGSNSCGWNTVDQCEQIKLFSGMLHFPPLGLEVRHLLGSGSFAQVYACFDPKDNKHYALKTISKEAMAHSKIRLFAKQAEILASLDHPNVVKFHQFHQSQTSLMIKMQLIRGGTLRALLQDRKQKRQPLKESQIAVLFRHLLQGVRYLHSLNIIHRDLKPGKYLHYEIENILFADCDNLTTVKIVDFGLSAKLEVHNPANIKAQCGTLLYMAPEVFSKPSYTKSVDLWACAVILYMIFNEGRHPFYHPGMRTEEFKLRLKNDEFPALPHPLAQSLLEKLSKKEYQERYNVNDALKHPWITRNEADEIPLSIHQSYKGFDSTNEVSTIFKLFLTLGVIVPHYRIKPDESYRSRICEFINKNEAVRVYSPSRRKMKDKNNELFNKMRQIFHASQDLRNRDSEAVVPLCDPAEEASPTLRKHQSFFQSLFDKEKSFDLIKSDKYQLSRLDLRNYHPNNYEMLEKEELLFSLRPKRLSHHQERETLQPLVFEKGVQSRIQHEIANSVNRSIKARPQAAKKRIFQKKASMDVRQKDQPRTKRQSQGRKDSGLSQSYRQISRRVSPSKIPQKPAFFNIATKNCSFTSRK